MTKIEALENAYDAIQRAYDLNGNSHPRLRSMLFEVQAMKYEELSEGLERITPYEALCIAKGRNSEAIKSVLARTQLGLKEAKDIVDNARKVWESF